MNAPAQAASNLIDSVAVRNLYAALGVVAPVTERVVEWSQIAVDESETRYAWQTEIGAPGTRVIDGRIEVERNPRIKPYFARGRLSLPGIFEEVYRVEPVCFNSLNSLSSLAINALYEPAVPQDADEELRAITAKAHASIMRQKRVKENASTAFRMGFAPFEPVWAADDSGQTYLAKLAFREQSTLERWLFDARASECVGAEFQTTTLPGITRYVLPRGDTPDTMRLVICNLNATGNNLEGVSPVRVIVGLRKLKEVLLNISGVSYQKYGVPIAQIVRDIVASSAADLAQLGGNGADVEINNLVNRLMTMEAQIAPVLPMPIGARVDYAVPTASMPDIRPMLEYIDALMALVFSNEGALLGSQSFGSYAMASVADNRFMRSAPVYAKCIADMYTELLHWMIRWNHSDPDSIQNWPEYTYRFAGTQDATRWAADMQVLVSAQVWTWPDAARRMAAANMGLPPDAFDNWSQVSADVSGQQLPPVPAEVV